VTGAEAKARLIELQTVPGDGDPEAAHAEADDVLCQLLYEIGYDDVVREWHKIPKWYA
jgi:hypothetical protein